MPQQLIKFIRDVPDFPKPGIMFRDITPLLADPEGLTLAAQLMADPFRNQNIDLVIGAESRGFIFGVVVARELKCGFVPVRKPGKLPCETISAEYQLEYGADKLQIHTDAVKNDQKILMVDDLLATGGTMNASCQMVEKLGGNIVGISFLIELAFLNGRDKLRNYSINSLISYDSE
ncbi:MAG: adenine phosphoribosyltransferase [Planctomycetes bacterium]|nr:adenine phosphoribosyltransferase [Planctomycetota bacterium]